MESEEILGNISKTVSDRLKNPIIITYLCVLCLYNWDIIYYLIFENKNASIKIKFIKEEYSSVYYERIFICLTIAVIIIVLFTILNTFINFGLKWFYRKDKEIITEVESYEKMDKLTQQLSESVDKISKLNSQIISLNKINESLTSEKINISISDISKKDYLELINFLNSKRDKEKLIFSMNELIVMLKKNEKVSVTEIYQNATYEHEMRLLVQYLFDLKLISAVRYRNEFDRTAYEALKLGTSFKDFLKMEDLKFN